MVKYSQNNPHHYYDLFLHTLHTVENLGDCASCDLRIAAFFHDIGKPYVAIPKQGRTVFYGHAIKSAEIAQLVLNRIGYAEKEVERSCFFIRHHDDFISWVLPSETYDRTNPYLLEISPSNLKAHITGATKEYACFETNDIHQIWSNLLCLCRADAMAQAEQVYRGKISIDSRSHKLKRIEAIEKVLLGLRLS